FEPEPMRGSKGMKPLQRGIPRPHPTLNNPWVLAHILSIFLGEAFFAIAFLAGVMYIFQENQLKSKIIGSHLKKLPSLITLDRINHLSLLLGFPLLTLSLVIGFVLAKEIWSDGWIWGAKETWSTVTWLLYAFLINGRLSLGWRGRRAALGAVIGFCIVVLTFIVGYLFPGQHRFE
ncbi:MAG: cytochrome c biogenesis protein CcsA, partial [Candidatus Dadabacteria bacterium]|nr:cytochrome c biogenesis protein CcsA [Candidatus Dadabacteria bacterium]